MDLTVLATPFYFATMEAERRWLTARSLDPAYASGQYERRDTTANLAMGVASLVAPFVALRLRDRAEWGRGRWARPLAATALAAGAVATACDMAGRRARRLTADADANSGRGPERLESIGGGAAVVALGAVAVVAASTWTAKLTASRLWEHRRWDLGTGALPVCAAIVGWDAIYYWNHRFMHEARYMWAVHVVHHSSERYNLSVALRQPVADALGTFVPYGLLSLAGIRPAHIQTARGINLIYQYWIHTEAIGRLGPAEEILNTASLHRVHHGSNPQYIDRNHGSIFIVWDRLFGTFEREEEPVVYGLTKNLDSFSPWRIIAHEYLDIARDVYRSTRWRDRLSFVFRGPGWAYERHRQLGWAATTEEAAAA